MTPPANSVRLSDAQRHMLKRLSKANYGELFIRGAGRRTYDALARHGYVERHLIEGWGKITDAGRQAVGDVQP